MKTQVSSQSSTAVGVLCAIGAATIFSTAGVIVRHLELPAWDVSFWRSALLVAAMLPLLVWQRRGVLIDMRNAGLALIASAVLLAGSFVSFILALGLAPVANVLLMFGATPFITALLARAWAGPVAIDLSTGEPVRLSELAQAVFRAFDCEQLFQLGALPTPVGENMSTTFPRSPAWLLGRPRSAIEGIVEWYSDLLACSGDSDPTLRRIASNHSA
jgi:hypothetical protein